MGTYMIYVMQFHYYYVEFKISMTKEIKQRNGIYNEIIFKMGYLICCVIFVCELNK